MRGNTDFYKALAEEIRAEGYKTFLYEGDTSAWIYILTPNNSWLYVGPDTYSGYDISYQYVPSKDFGSGCRYNEDALYEITVNTLVNAEKYGKNYSYRGWANVPNTYDGRTHRETVTRRPNHYPNAEEAIKNSWCFKDMIEI